MVVMVDNRGNHKVFPVTSYVVKVVNTIDTLNLNLGNQDAAWIQRFFRAKQITEVELGLSAVSHCSS